MLNIGQHILKKETGNDRNLEGILNTIIHKKPYLFFSTPTVSDVSGRKLITGIKVCMALFSTCFCGVCVCFVHEYS